MGFALIVTLVVLVLAMILFFGELLPAGQTALLAAAALLATGVLEVEEVLAGFSNEATITVLCMFVVSAGIERTGGVNLVSDSLTRLLERGERTALLTLSVGAGALSAFVNNTTVVAILLPALLRCSQKAGVSPSKLLIPLSFASMLGGCCTLVGTSTNLVVSAVAEREGLAPISMFELAPVGLALFVLGVGGMLVVAPWVLPDRRARAGARSSGEAPYLTEVLIDEGSPAIGQPLGSAEVFADLELEVLSLERMGLRRTPRPAPETPLEAGDVLRLRGDAAGLRALIQRDGVSIPTQREGGSHALQLVEVVIAPRSSLIGRRLGAVPWAERFSAVPVATRQRGRAFRGLELRTLRAGDVLLLDVRPGKLRTLEQSGAFVLVSEVAVSRFRRELLPFALSILVGVVACATLGLLPIAGAALVGAVLVLLTRCARLDEVVQAIDWNVLMLLAGVLSLGVAMEKTGAAQLFAEAFVDVVGGHGPAFVIAALFLATTFLTELLSNTATAALLTPVAIGMASALEIDPRPLVMTIAFGASTAMLTPIGYQTNTLVYGAGQYRFFDFARLGGLLIVPLTLAVTLLVPWVWPTELPAP